MGAPEAEAEAMEMGAAGGGVQVFARLADAETVPYWMQAAINLGTRFYRVAAAGEPRAGQAFRPHRTEQESACCAECGREHPGLVDEYYFWLTDSSQFSEPASTNPQPYEDGYQVSYYDQTTQESGLWQDETQLPQLLAWDPGPTVRLSWCRVHNGEFQQPRRSQDAVPVQPGTATDLTFAGRTADSLTFQVTGAQPTPPGYNDPAAPGFRYDLAADQAVALPLVAAPPPPLTYLQVLPAYPYFVYHSPGARLFPGSWYAPALAVACALRAHCRFEAALKWYERSFDPLHNDCTWVRCPAEQEPGSPGGGTGVVQVAQAAAGQGAPEGGPSAAGGGNGGTGHDLLRQHGHHRREGPRSLGPAALPGDAAAVGRRSHVQGRSRRRSPRHACCSTQPRRSWARGPAPCSLRSPPHRRPSAPSPLTGPRSTRGCSTCTGWPRTGGR